MKIPKIGLDTVAGFGVGQTELKKGPGLFPDCDEVPSSSECVSDARYPGEPERPDLRASNDVRRSVLSPQ